MPSQELAHHSPITLAVLAGGASVRMGKPKASLTLSGKPVLQYLLERQAWPGPTLLVTAPGREHPPGWERFDREVVDAVSGQGPLRGVLTALSHAATARVLVLTVDMPLLALEHLQWLIRKSIGMTDCLGLMLCRPIKGQMQIEPFPFLCRVEAADIISRRLAEGRRSVYSLTETPGFAAEPAPTDWPPGIWTNLNTPEDLTALQRAGFT